MPRKTPLLDGVSSTRHIGEPYLGEKMGQMAAKNYGRLSSVCPHPVRERHKGKLSVRRCGQCQHCNVNRRKEITGRCLGEAAIYPSICVTLTLADAHFALDWFTPEHWTKEIRNLKLRLQRLTGLSPKMRWTAELGGELGRPHAHVLIFNVPSHWVPARQQKMLNVDWWKYGHVTIDTIDAGTCRYVVEYITDKDKKGDLIKARPSGNIGSEYLHYWIGAMKAGRSKHGARFSHYPDPRTGLLERSCIEIDHCQYPLDQHQRKIVVEAGLLQETSALGAHLRSQLLRAGEILEHGGPELAEAAREQEHQRQLKAKRERAALAPVFVEINGFKTKLEL